MFPDLAQNKQTNECVCLENHVLSINYCYVLFIGTQQTNPKSTGLVYFSMLLWVSRLDCVYLCSCYVVPTWSYSCHHSHLETQLGLDSIRYFCFWWLQSAGSQWSRGLQRGGFLLLHQTFHPLVGQIRLLYRTVSEWAQGRGNRSCKVFLEPKQKSSLLISAPFY